jgi:hypothetical protein
MTNDVIRHLIWHDPGGWYLNDTLIAWSDNGIDNGNIEDLGLGTR